MPLSALLLVMLLSVVPAPVATGDGRLLSSITLYDGSSGVTPDESGAAPDAPWFSFTTVNLVNPSTVATQVANGSATVLDSTINDDNTIYAGYNNYSRSRTFVNPNFPQLDRSQGYVLSFTVDLTAESHANDNRAGFSVIAAGSDVAAGVPASIELGFQDGRIFAQNADFTAGEATTSFNPLAAGLVTYELDIQNDSYELRANGTAVLSGMLRDYTGFTGPLDLECHQRAAGTDQRYYALPAAVGTPVLNYQ